MALIEVEENEDFRLRSIESLMGYHFFVDDYQRGYKWTAQQALDLLNDINDFDIRNGKYCLQPVVTKDRSEDEPAINAVFPGKKNVYELIDGQQRMTTIYMILAVIDNSVNFFSIAYGTRISSADFLNKITSLKEIVIDEKLLDAKVEIFESEINKHWELYAQLNPAFDNVDNYHFYQVYQVVQLWCKKYKCEIQTFKNKLLAHTHVIWYRVGFDEISEKIFIKINSGKIALTNAELIKALFLIDSAKEYNIGNGKLAQTEIAGEWDNIEFTLQNDEFWYFINENPRADSIATRIDFLFNILTVKTKTERDNFYSYRVYVKNQKEGIPLDWNLVKDLFDRFQEWFEDRTLYHLIGFVIYRNITNIQNLITLSKENGKHDFIEKIKALIKKEFKKKQKDKFIYDPDKANYNDDQNVIKTILLLFNIETYQASDANFRFPFDRLKKEKWSIEHIHAQHPEKFTKNKEAVDWAKDSLLLVRDFENASLNKNELPVLNENESIKKRLEVLAILDISAKMSENTKTELIDLPAHLSQYLDSNLLSNLALLDRNTNSSLGNDIFLKKRDTILAIDNQGWVEFKGRRYKAFIPICTKNVFVKYYTKKVDEIQMSFWGFNDRKYYIKAICERLSDYFPKKVVNDN